MGALRNDRFLDRGRRNCCVPNFVSNAIKAKPQVGQGRLRMRLVWIALPRKAAESLFSGKQQLPVSSSAYYMPFSVWEPAQKSLVLLYSRKHLKSESFACYITK